MLYSECPAERYGSNSQRQLPSGLAAEGAAGDRPDTWQECAAGSHPPALYQEAGDPIDRESFALRRLECPREVRRRRYRQLYCNQGGGGHGEIGKRRVGKECRCWWWE